MARVSKDLIIALKLGDLTAYRIAQLAEVNPNTLSKLINGIDPVKTGDPRILAVGKVLGIPAEKCFEPEPQAEAYA